MPRLTENEMQSAVAGFKAQLLAAGATEEDINRALADGAAYVPPPLVEGDTSPVQAEPEGGKAKRPAKRATTRKPSTSRKKTAKKTTARKRK